MDAFSILLSLARSLLRSRQQLLLENMALRQQVAVLRRGVKRPKLAGQDRIFWITMLRLLDTWRAALHIVQPDTVVRWHRRGSTRSPLTDPAGHRGADLTVEMLINGIKVDRGSRDSRGRIAGQDGIEVPRPTPDMSPIRLLKEVSPGRFASF